MPTVNDPVDEVQYRKENGTGTQGYEPPALVNGQVENRRPHYADDLWRSPEALRKMGMDTATHEMCLRRDPRYWNDIEFSDRLEQAIDNEPGLYPLKREDGSFAKIGDLIICAKPKKDDEELLKLSNHAIDDLGESIDQRSSKSFRASVNGENQSVSRFDSNDPNLYRRARMSSDQNRADGLVGPTQGVDYNREIASREGVERLRKIQSRFLNPGSRRIRIAEGSEGDRQLQRMENAAKRAETFTSGTSFPHGAIPPTIGRQRPAGFADAAAQTRANKGK